MFSEEKRKRRPRKREGEEELGPGEEVEEEVESGWKPFELISLYAVHKDVDLGATDFWALVAAGMRGKGHVKSEEECRARWEQAIDEKNKRVQAMETTTKANKDASTEPSAPVEVRSSPRLKAA